MHEGPALSLAQPAGAALAGWRAAALTLLLYPIAAHVGRLFAVQPASATPFDPAAGIAVLSVLLAGGWMLPAVALGALGARLLQIESGAPHAGSALAEMAVSAALVVGATLQAWVGATGLRRFVAQPTSLVENRDVVRLYVAAGVASLIGTAVGNAALWTTGLVPGDDPALDLLVRWAGAFFGIAIVLPIGLALVGQPREAWAQRRVPVGVVLSLATVAVGAGLHAVERWHGERRATTFERDASSAAVLLEAQLRESSQALRALHGAISVSAATDAADIPAAMRDWVAAGRLRALGWAPWLRPDAVPDFEDGVRRAGTAGFRVFDAQSPSPVAVDLPVVPIRALEPLGGPDSTSLGLNQMSIPALRAAIETAARTAEAVASAGIELPQQDAGAPRPMAVTVFRAVSQRRTGGADDLQTPLGVAFATLRPGDALDAVRAGIPAYLTLCIDDVTPDRPPYRLGGDGACDSPGGPRFERPVAFAGRRWMLRVHSRTGELPDARAADVWLFALVGFGATAILGGFLLATTGRARRIETAVRERTAALLAEVGEREAAQTALQESEQRFRNILNNVPMGICYTDLVGNVKLVNPRFCEIVGLSEAELLVLNLLDVTHPDDRADDIHLSKLLVDSEITTYRRQKRYLRPDGVKHVQATVNLLRDAAGVARRLVRVVDDVTEHQKLEDAERAREAAEASNRAKSDFLSRMSHELRTPLNAMLGFAQLLELDPRQPLSDTQRPWVGQIQQAGWHLLEMINDVLDLSRIESGNLRLSNETLNLEELIAATSAMVQADADRRGIAISVMREPGTLSAIGDPTRVKQILINLLSNAVKYNADGGSVHIHVHQVSAQRLEIDVVDSGLGMDDAQLQQLFEPFNRLGREKSKLEGTGIGLVISRRLAELMGGALRVTSTAGVGSTFTLVLPCDNEPDTVRSDFDPMAEEPADYHRRVVHYVEDNETNVEVMRGILAQRPQVELEVSVTGLDGLAGIRARRPDLILLDMHLPDISGMELLRHLKSDPMLAPIPVVVVSADALPEQLVAAEDAGCAAYLTKPVNIAELLRHIDTLLDEMDTRYG